MDAPGRVGLVDRDDQSSSNRVALVEQANRESACRAERVRVLLRNEFQTQPYLAIEACSGLVSGEKQRLRATRKDLAPWLCRLPPLLTKRPDALQSLVGEILLELLRGQFDVTRLAPVRYD